jgi:hypothetical protein
MISFDLSTAYFGGRQRWDEPRRIGDHLPDDGVVKETSMLDRVDAGIDGGCDALRADRVRGNAEPQAVRFFDRRLELLGRESRLLRADARRQHPAGRDDLDTGRARFVQRLNGFHHLRDRGDFSADEVRVPAGDGEDLPRRQDARAFEAPRGLGARSLHGGKPHPSEIADRRDPRFERAQRSFRAAIARARRSEGDRVGGEVRAAVKAEVDVRVDQTGDKGAAARVDRTGQGVDSARALGRAGVHDATVLCDEHRIVHRIKPAPVVEARAANNQGVSHRASIFPAMQAASKRGSRHERAPR